MTARYRIRRKPISAEIAADLQTEPTHPDGTPIEPYGLWDTVEHRWVDKWGEPDEGYWACCRDVAMMRRRDMNGHGGLVIA